MKCTEFTSHHYIVQRYQMTALTFTHDPKDFKFIHYITDVKDLHEVERYVAGGTWSSGGGGPATGWQEAASCWLPRGECQMWAIISDTCLHQVLAFTCTKTHQITYTDNIYMSYLIKWICHMPKPDVKYVVKWIHQRWNAYLWNAIGYRLELQLYFFF